MDIKEAVRILYETRFRVVNSTNLFDAVNTIVDYFKESKPNECLKLNLVDSGDKDNGMPECEYVIDCPFGSGSDDAILDDFAQSMRHTYREYSNGRIRTFYSNGYKPE